MVSPSQHQVARPNRRLGAVVSVIVLLVVAIIATADVIAGDTAPTPTPTFDNAVEPFVARYCIDCHSGDEPEGGYALDSYTGIDAVTQNADSRKDWRQVIRQLRGRMMPPEDSEEPPLAERRRVVAWLEEEIDRVDCSGQRNPGRVTLRRLNRVEYGNTVRDLLGVEFDATATFPQDDVGYGFDHIADVLSLSSLHLEKYVEAAEQIAHRAIRAPEEITEPRIEIDPRRIRGGDFSSGESILLSTNGRVAARVDFPKDGQYVVRIRAFADQAGDELAKMQFVVDGEPLNVVGVSAEAEEPQWYAAQLRLRKGTHRVGVAFINDYWRPKEPGREAQDRNLFLVGGEAIGPIDDKLLELRDSHQQILPQSPTLAEWRDGTWHSLARRTVSRLVSRAFRRPARPTEIDRLIDLMAATRRDGQSYERGMQHVVAAVLVSPHFLFRGPTPLPDDTLPDDTSTDDTSTDDTSTDDTSSEGGSDPGATHDALIDEFELASRLSYFLWSTMPDEELFRLAEGSALRDNLDGQVARMLADKKAGELVRNFVGQWLETRRLSEVAPDPDQFADFDEPLRQAMSEEPERLFTEIVQRDLSIMTLLDADFTYVNERLARHYGLQGVFGDRMRRISLDAESHRGGVITMASVLTITSETTRTSAVKRGKWVMENLLNSPPPEPPAATPPLEETANAAPGLTARELMELHRANPVCASCHRRMDPIGFSLEHFDAIGRWRDREADKEINTSGQLPDGREFDGADGLKEILLADRDEFRRAFADKLLTYALGRGLEFYDQCTIDDIVKTTVAEKDRFSAIVLAIVNSDPFQKRRRE